MNRFGWLLVCCLVSLPLQASEKDGQALTTGDYVRVRAEPSLTAPQLGFLYKNLLVSVLEKSANTSMVEGKAHYWYRVRQDTTEGWCSGAFLDFNVPGTILDTYSAPAEMDWFFSRYGSSTAFQDNTFNADSFTVDEYRRLIAATHASGTGTSAPLVLKRSLYAHLHEQPDDSKFLYLKKKLYTREFLIDMLSAQQFDVLPLLPADLATQAFTAWLKTSPQESSYMCDMILGQIPESEDMLRATLAGILLTHSSRESDVRQNAGLLRLAVAGDGLLLKYAHYSLRDDFETVMTAVKNNHAAVQWASDRLRADVRIRDMVGKKAMRKDDPPPGGLIVDKSTPPPAVAPVPSPAPTRSSAELSIKAPETAENGSVVPMDVTINPPLASGDTLTLMVGKNRVCDVRPGGNITLDRFSTRVRMPGSGEVSAVIARKNGGRAESASYVNVGVAGVIPASGSDNRELKIRTRENEVLVLLQNAMGRSGYVNGVVFTLPEGTVSIDTTLWLATYPFIAIRGPNVSGNPTVEISLANW